MTRAVIFRTHSDAEASIVRGLLEAHGLAVRQEQAGLRHMFPLPAAPFGEIRLTVDDDDASEARRVLATFEQAPRFAGPRVVPMHDDLAAFEQRLGYRFRDRERLEQALTHRSFAHETSSGERADNESLEFLGDAVLGFVIADVIFQEFPLTDEGMKSKIKASLVSAVALAQVADRLGLGEHLHLGRGEEKTGGRHKQALLSDACEALIAAIYLDGGIEAARTFILREFEPQLETARHEDVVSSVRGDFKSALQEYLQAKRHALPEYRTVRADGPDHAKTFHVAVRVGAVVLAEASGRSKKDAEQDAARRALSGLLDGSVDFDDAAR